MDVNELKSRLLAATGDILGAANVLGLGQELDKQDRYTNNRTTEYLLQKNRIDDTCSQIKVFTSHEG